MTPGPGFKSPILSPAPPLTTLMTLDMLVGLAGLHNHKIKTDTQMRTKQYCPRVSLSDTDEFRWEIQGPRVQRSQTQMPTGVGQMTQPGEQMPCEPQAAVGAGVDEGLC